MSPRLFKALGSLFVAFVAAGSVHATTTITFTRAEVTNMANLFETDCVSISALANSQYPNVTGTWDFIFPHTSISSDGDVHTDMAINSSGTGTTSNNTGASPIVAEVINATSSQLSHLTSLNGRQANYRGIFRLYTEHAGERHFEIHPITQLQLWNGASFTLDTDYHNNIVSDPDGTTHSSSVLAAVFDASNTATAVISADNNSVTLTFPSPSVNYTQYAGTTLSALQTDALGDYFMFRPNLVPSATVRCRVVANTAAAAAVANIQSGQSITVNALTRTDMSAIAAQISTLAASQQRTFTRPIELIVLGTPNLGPTPTPTPTATPSPSPTPSATPTATPSPSVSPTASPSPTATPTPSPTGDTFGNTNSITINGNGTGAGSPYPSIISVNGLIGKITKVTAKLTGVSQSSQLYWASNIDIQVMGPGGQSVMLMSDAGGQQRVNNATLAFDDSSAASLPQNNRIRSGTFKPTNYTGDSDAFPAPASPSTSALLSAFNNTNPNGDWSLFVLDEFAGDTGSISGGWSLTITTAPSAPDVVTNPATSVTSSSATLNGTVNPLGQGGTWQFQLGLDTNYGFTQVVQSVNSGTTNVPVALNLRGLRPNTTYHFRLIGSNGTGNAFGADRTFTTPAATDSDADGMPNDYESNNGFDPGNGLDGAQDSDGDGMTNAQEFQAGTDPHSPDSVLRIKSLERSGGDIVITFPSVFGKSYTVEQAPTANGPWTTLTDGLLGTGDLVTALDVEAADNNLQRFYRILVVTP